MKWKKKFRLLVISLTAICVIVLSVGGYFKSRKIKKTSESIEMGNQYLSDLNYEQAIASYRNA